MDSIAFGLIVGLILLVVGAEGLVRGASALALRLGLTPLIVGLTVVAFGTSTPELVVSLEAALAGKGAIAAGNVVGSNIANIGLILGFVALLRPMSVQAQLVRLDLPLLVGVSILMPALLWGGLLRWEAAILAALLLVYVAIAVRLARRDAKASAAMAADAVPRKPTSLPMQLLFIAGGLGLLIYGADLFVEAAVRAAREAGVSERVVGLTLVAVGTSLPELATSLIAAYRGESDLAVGNVVGSNLFNALGILGVAGLVRPLADSGLAPLDLGMMLLFAVLLLPLAKSGLVISRKEGLLFLAIYGVYMVLLARG